MIYAYFKRIHLLPLALALFVLAGTALPAAAQNTVPPPEERPSPLAMAQTKLDDDTYVKITYGSPRKRDPRTGNDREIFGALVPYGQVWRLGANEATEITTTGDINFGGQTLPAGTYTLFAVPGQDTWTIIVNRDLGQWGAYSYNENSNVMSVEVPAEQTQDIHEAFTISFEEDGANRNLVIVWDQTQVTVPISAV